MQFTSFQYLIFLPVAGVCFYLIKPGFRWMVLLVFSILFYLLFSWRYLLILFFLVLLNYYIGLKIYKRNGHLNKALYILGISINILVLAGFKYYHSLLGLSPGMSSSLEGKYPLQVATFMMPMGLSFFTLTMLSYLIDIKRKTIEPETNPALFSTYSLLFMRILQGPIDRAGSLIRQLKNLQRFNYRNTTDGLKLIAWGFFKKIIIADQIAPMVQYVYSHPNEYSGPVILLVTCLFAIQIYADFSGYTDIAIGSARIFNIDLTPNFRHPYLSHSIKEFWGRWHISFSSWLRDYIFLPVAYSTSGKLKHNHYFGIRSEYLIYVLAVSATFFICGIWHGSGWNFLIWGGIFAIYLIFARLTLKTRNKISEFVGLNRYPFVNNAIQILTTFLLVSFAWIFFRAGSATEAFLLVRNSFTGWSSYGLKEFWDFFITVPPTIWIWSLFFSTILLVFVEFVSGKKDIIERVNSLNGPVRWMIYYSMILVLIYFSDFGPRTFLYQQF
jgi:alginate O-acetyltransferase complex protein AlgI